MPGGHRTAYRYNDRNSLIESATEDISRELRIDEEGNIRLAKETSHTHHIRFEYTYAAKGNWTGRVAWSRFEPNPNFERSHRIRREITYYE